jgi:hypothetical protein
MTESYEAPLVRELGSIEQLTEQNLNKVGPNPDTLSAINPNVVGSFVPAP